MADTYTIQFRRGMYADFDTSKIRPGEPVAILGNDPSVPSGKALYIAFAANDVRRLCSIEDISEMVNAGEFVGPQGPKGEKGERGEKGADGTVAFESLTPEQKESLRGISIESASVDTDGNLTITFSNGDSEDVGNIMGPQGIQGPKGDKGDVGPQGLKGDKGDVGPKGDNMSDEQAAQIEQNKKDVDSLKEDLDYVNNSGNIDKNATALSISSSGVWQLADSSTHVVIEVKGGDKVLLSANNTYMTIYAVLTEHNAINAKVAKFSTDADWNTRKTLAKGTVSEELTMPSDAKYLYLCTSVSGNSYLPKSILINGAERIYNIRGKIDENTTLLAYLSKNIDELLLKDNATIQYRRTLMSDDNIDAITDNGYFDISAVSASRPSGVYPKNCVGQRLTFFSYTKGNRLCQMMVNKTGQLSLRMFVDGIWSDWNTLATDKEVLTDTNSFEYNTVANDNETPNDGIEISVLSYNVGLYNNGNTSEKGMADNVIDEKVFNIKKLIMDVNPYLIGLQEDTTFIDRGLTKNAHEYLYKPIFPVKSTLGGSSVYSKKAFINSGNRPIGNERYMAWCEVSMNGKTLLFISAHPSPDTTEHRLSEYQNIFDWISGRTYEWCIIAGDFNTIEEQDRINLKNICETNSFTMANGGYLGWLKTTYLRSLDNILVSSKCIINAVKVHSSLENDLISDHYPLSAKITLLN